jgi:hypothetical protein
VIDQAVCQHESTEPVDVRSHETGGTVTVARICRDCLVQLEAGWGCGACEWLEVEPPRRLCQTTVSVEHVLVRPCKEHA